MLNCNGKNQTGAASPTTTPHARPEPPTSGALLRPGGGNCVTVLRAQQRCSERPRATAARQCATMYTLQVIMLSSFHNYVVKLSKAQPGSEVHDGPSPGLALLDLSVRPPQPRI